MSDKKPRKQIRCICSPECTTMIWNYDKKGRPRKFALRHYSKIMGINHYKDGLFLNGIVLDSSGYRLLRTKLPNGRSVYIQEHRKVIEDHFGRKLNKKESIHHINHNKLDNRLDNLILCSSHLEHAEIEGVEKGLIFTILNDIDNPDKISMAINSIRIFRDLLSRFRTYPDFMKSIGCKKLVSPSFHNNYRYPRDVLEQSTKFFRDILIFT